MCREWIQHLVGLWVSVPERWWNGQSKSKAIFDGTVSAVHLENSKESKCFQLSFFDCEEEVNVRYDVISTYVDKNDKNYDNFYVPAKPVPPIKHKVRLFINFTFICKIVNNIFLCFCLLFVLCKTQLTQKVNSKKKRGMNGEKKIVSLCLFYIFWCYHIYIRNILLFNCIDYCCCINRTNTIWNNWGLNNTYMGTITNWIVLCTTILALSFVCTNLFN